MAQYANRQVPEGHGTTSYFGSIPKPTKEVTVDMLDYGFVEECEDPSELRGILELLQSGKEGYYPQLMQAAEKKMLSLIPERERSKIMRLKIKPSKDDEDVAKAELADWMDDISKMDKRITSKKSGGADKAKPLKSRKLPPVRGEKPTNSTTDGTSKQSKPSPSAKEVAAAKSRKVKTLAPMDRLVGEMPTDENGKGVGFSESIGGYDFRAWEKFDVDKALEEMDKDEVMSDDEKKRKLATARNTQKEREAHRKMRLARDRENLSSDFLEALDAMSKEEREFMATRERQKGNECFKAGELDEAVVNYTRSAALNPFNAPVHANRSLAYLRLKMFERAEDDCTHALEVDPKYVKAWSRRGMVRHRRGKYAGAMTDFETALELEPSNVEVSKLLSKSKAKFEELEGVDNKAGTSFTRVTIEEVDSDNDDDDDGGDDESGGGQGFRKISIVMDDDSDSDEESDGDEDQAPANSEFTKVQIVCDDDESDDSGDEAEKKYTTVSIVDVDGDEDDDESDDDDDVEQTGAQFVKVQIECDESDDDDDGDDDDGKSEQFVKVQIECDDSDDDDDDDNTTEQKFVKVQIDCDDDSESDNDSDVAPPPAPTPSTLKMQGTKLFAQGDYQGASEQFLKAIEMLQLSGGSLSTEQVADLVSCSNNRAACLLKLEKYDEARHDCDRVLKHSPQNHKALLRRGTTFEKTGQLESALQDFQSALSISPGLKEAVLGVERLSSLLKKQSASVSAEAKAEAIKQKDLGNAAFKQKQLDVALDHYGQSVSLDSQLFASFCNRALIYIRLGKFQEAINDCDKTLELDVDNAKALYRRGLALFELKEHKRALAMFEKLVSINPDNQQALGQIKKVKDILAKMPAPKISEVKDVTPKISEVKDVTPIPTSPTKDSSSSSSNTASSSSPKKAAPSPVKPLDTAKVAAAAKEKMKTKMAKGKKSAIPKTAYEFENYWRTLKSDPQAFYNYFKQLKPRQIPKLFKGSINEDILSTILMVVEKFMISEDCARAYDTMVQITKINRISTVLLLVGKEDKSVASSICNRLKAEGGNVDESGLQSVADVFEVALA